MKRRLPPVPLYSLVLQPLDGGRRVSHGLAGQHDIPHPGRGHRAVEGQGPGRRCTQQTTAAVVRAVVRAGVRALHRSEVICEFTS